jgi:hypothetical protein
MAIKKLTEKQDQLIDFVSNGGAKSYEHYSAIVGEIKGLTYAMNELKDTNDKLLQEDNNE